MSGGFYGNKPKPAPGTQPHEQKDRCAYCSAAATAGPDVVKMMWATCDKCRSRLGGKKS